jgi:hypothetical protein
MKQMRQSTIGMAFSDADSDYHFFSKLKVEDGEEIDSYIPESRLSLDFLSNRWQWTTPLTTSSFGRQVIMPFWIASSASRLSA